MARTALVGLCLALSLAPAALAQDPFPPLEQRPLVPGAHFQPGERWLTCGGLRFRVARVDGAPFEASIAWTHSVTVLDDPRGFALRCTLTSVAWQETRAGILTTRSWCDDAPGPLDDAGARTWTYAFDPGWSLVDVRGPERSIRWLIDRVRPHPAEPVTGALRDLLAARGARAIEGFLLPAADHLGRPVRAVAGSLARGPILPGAVWPLGPDDGPPGEVRYLGLDWTAGHFLATWDVGPRETLTARFLLDQAGRLQWLNGQHASVVELGGLSVRSVEELAFGIIRIGEEPPVWTPPLVRALERGR